MQRKRKFLFALFVALLACKCPGKCRAAVMPSPDTCFLQLCTSCLPDFRALFLKGSFSFDYSSLSISIPVCFIYIFLLSALLVFCSKLVSMFSSTYIISNRENFQYILYILNLLERHHASLEIPFFVTFRSNISGFSYNPFNYFFFD